MPDSGDQREDPSSLPEKERLLLLRRLVDITAALLRQGDFSLGEALNLVAHARGQALRLFPGMEETYDLIYTPRFERILRERYGEWV